MDSGVQHTLGSYGLGEQKVTETFEQQCCQIYRRCRDRASISAQTGNIATGIEGSIMKTSIDDSRVLQYSSSYWFGNEGTIIKQSIQDLFLWCLDEAW